MTEPVKIAPYGPYQWTVSFRWLDEDDWAEDEMLVFTKEWSLVEAYDEAETSLTFSGEPHVITKVEYVGEIK